MNEQNNRFSLFETNQRRTPPGRYLGEEERLKRRKKRQQQMMLRQGAVGIAILAVLILIIVLIVRAVRAALMSLKANGTWMAQRPMSSAVMETEPCSCPMSPMNLHTKSRKTKSPSTMRMSLSVTARTPLALTRTS